MIYKAPKSEWTESGHTHMHVRHPCFYLRIFYGAI